MGVRTAGSYWIVRSIPTTPSAGSTVIGTTTSPSGATPTLAGSETELSAAARPAQLQIAASTRMNESVLTIFIARTFLTGREAPSRLGSTTLYRSAPAALLITGHTTRRPAAR